MVVKIDKFCSKRGAWGKKEGGYMRKKHTHTDTGAMCHRSWWL